MFLETKQQGNHPNVTVAGASIHSIPNLGFIDVTHVTK